MGIRRIQVDKSVQTDHDIDDFFADIGIEEYTDMIKKSYGVYTVEELLCVILKSELSWIASISTSYTSKSLRSKMKTIHARELSQVIRFEFGTKLAKSYSGKLMGKSALHVVESEAKAMTVSIRHPLPKTQGG